MDLVVDANILFAALIKNSTTRKLFFYKAFHPYAPDFLLEELAKYRNEILNKTGQTETHFLRILNSMRNRLLFIAKEDLQTYKERVLEFTPDVKDWPYLAVALKIGATIWSNDDHLKNQDKVEVMDTAELIAKIGSVM